MRDSKRPVPPPVPPHGTPTPEPTVRFLGPDASRNGPFGVLGLPVGPVSEPDVLGAVHAAMDRIDAHPEARTPAANEARLAVHAAAANLLDASVLEELLKRLPGGAARGGAGGPRPNPPARQTATRGSAGLEADLIRCIAAEGGWSRRSMDRYLMVAHAKGYASTEAMSAIEHIVGRPGVRALGIATVSSPAPAAPVPAAAGGRTHEPLGARPDPAVAEVPADEPGGGLSPLGAGVLIVAVFVLMGVTAWAVLSAMDGGAAAGPEAEPGRVSSASPVPDAQGEPPARPAEAPPPKADRPLDNGPAITHVLEVATEGLGLDTEGAAADFDRAVAALSVRWVDISLSDRLAAQDQIVGYLYRVSGQSSLTARAFDAIERGAAGINRADRSAAAPGPSEITSGVWSMGTLVRLRREQNLPSAAIRRIDRAMLRGPEGLGPNAMTFRAGAVSALRSLADRLAVSGAALPAAGRSASWAAWIGSARAATAGDGVLLDSVLIAATEAVLRASGEPGTDAVGLLTEAMSWRAGGAARAWLMRAFADRSLGSDDVHALTLAVATRSRADGVDPSMVLPRGAVDSERRALGERYRAAWGLDASADQDKSIAVFIGAASDDLRETPRADGRDEVDVLASVVRTARLNAAAALLWRADTAAATDMLGKLDPPTDPLGSGDGAAGVSDLFSAKMGTWAESYLDAGSQIPRRLSLIGTLATRGGPLEPMEAEVVVAEALRGSPQRVRDAAAAVVESAAGQPAVINAVLESLPLMPRTDRNARIIEIVSGVSLPDVDASGYPIAARRAMVERLLEVIAGHGIYAHLDALAGLLGEAYSVRLRGGTAGAGSASIPTAAVPAAHSARVLADRWTADAAARAPAGLAGLGVEEIERRRTARRSMASGLVQEFHAEQLALFELMAQVVASEQPDRIAEIRSLVESVSRRRAAARDVLIQIEVVERAMLSLWRHRFGEVTG